MSVIDIIRYHSSCEIESIDIAVLQVEHTVVNERNFDSLGSWRHVESCRQLSSVNNGQKILNCTHSASGNAQSICATVVAARRIEADSVAGQSESSGLNDAEDAVVGCRWSRI